MRTVWNILKTAVVNFGRDEIILLVWVFYSSIIVLFGAELTNAYTRLGGRTQRPDEHADGVRYAPQMQEQT